MSALFHTLFLPLSSLSQLPAVFSPSLINMTVTGLFQNFAIPHGMTRVGVYPLGGGGDVSQGGPGAFVAGALAILPNKARRVVIGWGGL